MRFLKRQPAAHAVLLYLAVGSTFGAIGFVNDLIALPQLRPIPMVLAMVVMCGAISCGYLAASIHGLRWIPFAIAAQIGLMLGLDRLFPPSATPPAAVAMAEAIAARAHFDGIGCMMLAIAGYAFFVGFISRQGLRQIRLDTEIGLAREIHEGLVPPIDRRVGGLEIVGRSVPSTEVGGDLLDVVEDHGRTLVIVADVSGHGVHAGTLMAMVRSAVRARVASECTLEELFTELDRLLIELRRPDRFVTVAALRFHPEGTVEALLAGHVPVVIVRRGGGIERIESVRPPIGVPGPMAASRLRCEAGDLFALLTDGLPETVSRSRGALDLEPLEEVLRLKSTVPLGAVADAVFERVRRHGPADDDQTLLLVRRL